MTAQINAPERLSAAHILSGFDSGEPALNEWLRRRALSNELAGASRTYAAAAAKHVVGYYSLAAGALAHIESPGRIRRNMPDPIPVMILGRLAVDKQYQGLGIGTGLLRDAVLRTTQAAGMAGIRAILVHAISEDARRFYKRYGFIGSPVDPMTVMITVAEAVRMRWVSA